MITLLQREPTKSISVADSFPHTHYKVKTIDHDENSQRSIPTDNVMLLDLDVFVDCQTLKFAHSVWRSSKDALVGFYPRMYSHSQLDTSTLIYEDIGYVIRNSAYSIMLPSAVLLKKEYLESLEQSYAMKRFSENHPECLELSVPFWAMKQGAPSPIWVDAYTSIDIKKDVELKPFHSVVFGSETNDSTTRKNKLNEHSRTKSLRKGIRFNVKKQRTLCMNQLMTSLKIKDIPSSFYKSTQANSYRHLIWNI